ncbi:3-oxoacyl-ACP reductase FabG [Roseovarius spongiae]|uniref:3-oxoacyl-ACP reductase FabG n=1 Tax=Roseovarius spongiae TaxID=2320272 RepID=A0A3A8AX03_9RHOB|nr:3-oxoacyl-ACP reductase FabG [Roseovarius spongiae]RKF15310.1 3-oxoacyl-ACP reductase FabG [Roseovarius spongiae]
MLTPIKDRSAIVTGASKGIGRGIAAALARQGARVTLAARHEDGLKRARAEMETDGAQLRHSCCDVADWDSVRALVDGAAEAQGGLDILCANAGVYPQTPMEDMSPAEWDEVMAVNLRSAFLAVKAAIPHFRERGGGRVILTSSITGPLTGYRGWTHYGASKAGQLGFLRSAAMELAPLDVTVNAVLPGNIITEGFEDNGPDYMAAMIASVPLRRLGTVDDIANTVLFLASDEAAYITGQQIVIDGGQTVPESLDAMPATATGGPPG